MKIPSLSERRAKLSSTADARRMAASLSSTEPAIQPFGVEVLEHSADAIDLSRANNGGLPLLVNHDAKSLPIGRIENIHLDSDKLRGELVFSEATQAARDAFALVEDGTIGDVSLRYKIHQHRVADDGSVTITRWMPVEGSLASVPGDPTVGVGRTLAAGDSTMPEDVIPEVTTSDTPTTKSIITLAKERASAGYAAGEDAALARINEIDEMTRSMKLAIPDLAADLDALAEHCKTEKVSAEQYRMHTLELIGGAGHPLTVAERGEGAPNNPGQQHAPSRAASAFAPPPAPAPVRTPGASHRTLIEPGATGMENACRGMELSILERAGTKLKPEESQGNQYRGWSMLDMARDCLELSGTAVRGLSSEQIARHAIAMGQRAISPGTANYATADFPAVTENVMTKRVHDAFAAAEVTWQTWCSTTEVPDFKLFTIPRLSQISSLPTVAENAAYTNLTRADAKESATLTKQGGLISYTWEAIVNDDQRMFSATAMSLGESAARTLDEKAYAVLTTNALMGDGTALFAAGHSNLDTEALALPSIVSTRTRMARQTDDGGETLGIVLRYIIVPEELRDTADNLAGSEYLPWDSPGSISDGATAAGTSVGGSQRINTVRGTFTVVPTVRLTNATDWYAAGGRGTVEIAFLNGNRNPAIDREEGWDTDALHYKIRHPSVAYAVDWRALQYNDVA